jgi:MFS family permease
VAASPVSELLRIGGYRALQFARLTWILGVQMVGVAVGWEVYARTGSTLDLGLVGLVQFLPALLLFPVTGVVADTADRTWVLRACAIAQMVAVAGLLGCSLERAPIPAIYACLVLLAAARAFSGPASASILPQIVPGELFTRAVALGSSVFQVASIAGPALGGLVYAATGRAEAVYAFALALLGVALASLAWIPRVTRPAEHAPRRTWSHVFAGLRFLRSRPALFAAVLLDLFAVLLGGAVALLPAVARDVLHAGPETLGLLRAAPALGAASMAAWLAFHPIRRSAGRLMFGAVAVFGLATIGFGLSTDALLSTGLLVLMGAADEVSVVIRQTLLQIGTPDAMRGRVSAVNLLFVGVSNEIGELESGLLATWIGVVPAIVAGGVGTLAVAAAFSLLAPSLRKVDTLEAHR